MTAKVENEESGITLTEKKQINFRSEMIDHDVSKYCVN